MLLISESIKDKVDIDNMRLEDEKTDIDAVYVDHTLTPSCKAELVFKSGQVVLGNVVELERTSPTNLDVSFENFKITFSTSPQMANCFIRDDELESLCVVYESNLIIEKKINLTALVSRNIKILSQHDVVCQLVIKQRS